MRIPSQYINWNLAIPKKGRKLPLTAEPRFLCCRTMWRYYWLSGGQPGDKNLCFETALLTVTDGTALLVDNLHGSEQNAVSWLAGWNSLQEHMHNCYYIFSFPTFNFFLCNLFYSYITSSKTAQLLNWLHATTTILTSKRNSDIVSNIVQTDSKRKGGEKQSN